MLWVPPLVFAFGLLDGVADAPATRVTRSTGGCNYSAECDLPENGCRPVTLHAVPLEAAFGTLGFLVVLSRRGRT